MRPMKWYVAAKWEDRARAKQIMDALLLRGHTITYDWTTCEQMSPEQALRDRQGVMDADALIFVAEIHLRYQGALVEFGIAAARNIPIYVFGNALDTCLFIKLPQVIRTTAEEFFTELQKPATLVSENPETSSGQTAPAAPAPHTDHQ